jgi:hypothetical protein
MNISTSVLPSAPSLAQDLGSPTPAKPTMPERVKDYFNGPLDSHKSSTLRVGLLSGATTGGLMGLGSIPLIPHFTVHVGVGIVGTVIGGVAGAVAANTADTRLQAIGYGSAVGLVAGAALGLTMGGGLSADSFLLGTTVAAGVLSGAIGGFASTTLK